jgi:hypothetical protein
MRPRLQGHAGGGRGTPSRARAWRDPAVMAADQGQAPVEGGVRCRHDPRLVVASVCGQKPYRRDGLVRVMPLAWLVSAVTPRRRRHQLARPQATGPNPLQPPTERPTGRWVVQRRDGMPRVRVTVPGKLHDRLEGLQEVTRPILRVCGERGCRLYHMAPGEGCSMSEIMWV